MGLECHRSCLSLCSLVVIDGNNDEESDLLLVCSLGRKGKQSTTEFRMVNSIDVTFEP